MFEGRRISITGYYWVVITSPKVSDFAHSCAAQLLACLDALAAEQSLDKPIFVIGATNNMDSVDSEVLLRDRDDL